jgi:hypothetical protein
MAQPILTRNLQALTLTNITLAGTTSSSLIDISDCSVVAFQAVWTGTSPSGTVTLEGSLNGTTWSTFGASTISVTGASGNGLVNFSPAGMPFVRVTYTHVSGTTATLAVSVSTKQPA